MTSLETIVKGATNNSIVEPKSISSGLNQKHGIIQKKIGFNITASIVV